MFGQESPDDLVISMLAAAAANCRVTYSVPIGCGKLSLILESLSEALIDHPVASWQCEWVEESDESLAEEITDGRVDRLRLMAGAKSVSPLVHEACRNAFVTLVAKSVVDDPEIEILR